MKKHQVVLAAAAIAGFASISGAQSITTLIREGHTVAGVGTVTGTDGYAVNNAGQWIVNADTNNADTNIDGVIINTGSLYWQENAPLGGLSISSWDDHSLNNLGEYGGNLFLRPTGTGDSGIHFQQSLVIQEGAVSTAPQFSANTAYTGWFGAKFNDARQGILLSSVDDPNIPTTTDRALVAVTVSPAGALLSERVIAKENDVLPGSALTVVELETDSNQFDLAQNGHVIYAADLSGSALDSGVWRWDGTSNSLVAIEGANSPAAGRTWANLSEAKVGISGNGAHYTHTGTLSGDTATDSVLVVDGAIFKQEGDAAPGGFAFTSFGTVGAQVDDNGNVLWYGDWNDPTTTQDTGIFYNSQLLIQEGVTQIEGMTVITVRAFADTLALSDNGQFIVVELELDDPASTNNIEGAFMIAIPEPASLGLLGFAALAVRRRHRNRR